MGLSHAQTGLTDNDAAICKISDAQHLHGTGEMSARHCGKDTVYRTPSHTIFVTTNYLPRVDESDHGTWRRLASSLPYRYRRPHEEIEREGDLRGDPALRQRVRDGHDGQHEAVLAWLVRGAMRWYQYGPDDAQAPRGCRDGHCGLAGFRQIFCCCATSRTGWSSTARGM